MTTKSADSLLTLLNTVPVDALYHFLMASKETSNLIKSPRDLARSLSQEKTDEVLLEELEDRLGSQLYKFCHFFNFQDRWYDVYRTDESSRLDVEALLKNSRFALPSSIRSLEKLSPRIKVNVKIHYLSFEDDKLHLVVVEFASRSPFARNLFRFLFYPAENLIIAESTETGKKILQDIVLPRLQLSHIEKLPIRALNISYAANKYKTKKLKVRIDLETSGVLGLHSITLEGDDILEARKKLLARQEEALNLLNLGPWISVETIYFSMAIKKGVKLHRLDSKSLTALSDALTSRM